jgi:DNA ligase (NAD+)
MATLQKASVQRLRRVPRLGPVVAGSVHQFLHSERGRDAIRELQSAGVRMSEEGAKGEGRGRLAGKTFVVTGTLERFTRDEVKDLIRREGGRATSSVSASTDYVVAGEDPGSKLDEAKRRHVKVIGEKEFLELAGRAGS